MRELLTELIDSLALGAAIGLVLSLMTRTQPMAYFWCGVIGGAVMFTVDRINRREPSTGLE